MIRLEFRVGVNSGLVVQKSGNLLGDAVNIAARLESLSQPSGISISKDPSVMGDTVKSVLEKM